MQSKRSARSPKRSPKKSPKKKRSSPKKGGAIPQNLQNLTIPLALTVLSKGLRTHLKKDKKK